jgi:N-glycosylase/DNA lyase
VALFSLDQFEAIPVDTHVWSIAIRDYAPHLKMSKSLTPSIYDQVGDVFRNLFQEKAGWAHSVLFAAELPNFRDRLPLDLQKEMKDFLLEQKLVKQAKKQEKKSKSVVNVDDAENNEIDEEGI